MKKLIIKTAIITFVGAIVLAVALFGAFSLFAPNLMMEFTASLGWSALSGEYAYSAYQTGGEMEYLAYSCETAYSIGDNVGAINRYEDFFQAEGFSAYCVERDERRQQDGNAPQSSGSYEQYSYGNYACALYRAGRSEQALDFAFSKLNGSFIENNGVIALAVEGRKQENKAFCNKLTERLSALSFSGEEEQLKLKIITILEDFCK